MNLQICESVSHSLARCGFHFHLAGIQLMKTIFESLVQKVFLLHLMGSCV